MSPATSLAAMIVFSSASGSPDTRSICQGCRLPPVAARAALRTIPSISSGSGSDSRNPRTDRLAATASLTFTRSLLCTARATLAERVALSKRGCKAQLIGESECPKPISSKPFAPLAANAAASSPDGTPPISAARCSTLWSTAPGSIRRRSRMSSWAASAKVANRAFRSGAAQYSHPSCPRACPRYRSTGSADRRNRRSSSPHRRSCPVRRTW